MATHIVNFPDAHVQSTKITATASVGIGTSGADAYPLTIFKETEPEIRIHEGATQSSAAKLYSNNSNLYIQTGTNFTTGSSGDIAFQTMGGQSTHMIVKSDGKVGIGTDSPNSLGKLHVNGNVYVGDGSYLMSGYSSTSSEQYFGKEYGGRILAGMEIENTTLNGNYSQKLHLRTHHYGTTEGRRFTIDESGNVGINTTTPQYRLDVNGVARLNNVAFAAYRDQTTKDSSYTGTVVFNNEYFDQSGNYDTGTGLFTAPVAGIYHFSFNSYTNYAGDTVSRLFLYKNNGIYTQKGDEIDQHGNCIDVTIKLAVNDTVSLRGSSAYPVYLYASSAHNIFCGHLLTAI